MPPDRVERKLRVDISIVSGANEDLILQCLDSLFEATRADSSSYRITVTCNTPGTLLASQLRGRYPSVRVVENTVVRGFASNHNAVIRGSDADYVLVLNDDLVFLDDAVAAAIRFLERPENRKIGMLTPQLLNPDRSIQPCTFSFPTVPRALLVFSGLRDRVPTTPRLFWLARLLGRAEGRSRFWEHDRLCDVETFAGAAMFVRGAALRDVGLMDEVSQVGGEDTEWHRRFWSRGWRVVFFPGARVIHYGAQTVGRAPDLEIEFFLGWLSYFRQHRSRATYHTLAVSSAAVFGVRALLAMVQRNRALLRRSWLGMRTALASLRSGRPRRVATSA